MKQFTMMLIVACGFALSACGSDCNCKKNTSSSVVDESCTYDKGKLIADEQLCNLICNQTTRSEAIEILGNPDSVTDDMLIYSYTCNSNDSVRITLGFFGENETLTQVSRVGLGKYATNTLPECISACH